MLADVLQSPPTPGGAGSSLTPSAWGCSPSSIFQLLLFLTFCSQESECVGKGERLLSVLNLCQLSGLACDWRGWAGGQHYAYSLLLIHTQARWSPSDITPALTLSAECTKIHRYLDGLMEFPVIFSTR